MTFGFIIGCVLGAVLSLISFTWGRAYGYHQGVDDCIKIIDSRVEETYEKIREKNDR